MDGPAPSLDAVFILSYYFCYIYSLSISSLSLSPGHERLSYPGVVLFFQEDIGYCRTGIKVRHLQIQGMGRTLLTMLIYLFIFCLASWKLPK
jgi:hypothetical protein